MVNADNVKVGDVLNLTTPKGRLIMRAKVIRISPWSPYPYKLEWRDAYGVLCHESFDLNKCPWYLRTELLNQLRIAA